MKMMKTSSTLLFWFHCLLSHSILIDASETTMPNISQKSNQSTIENKNTAAMTVLVLEEDQVISEIADKRTEYNENSSFHETWNKKMNASGSHFELTTINTSFPVAQSRRLLIDDGIQDDQNLQELDPTKGDLLWRLQDTSFLQDLAREVIDVADRSKAELETSTLKESKNKETIEKEINKVYSEKERNPQIENDQQFYKRHKQNSFEIYDDDESDDNETLNYEYVYDQTEYDPLEDEDDDYEYDLTEKEFPQLDSEDQEEASSQDYFDTTELHEEDAFTLDDQSCSQDGSCKISNETITLRQKLQQDLDASFSDPLPARIRYRLKRKPSIYPARKTTDLGLPDIYEKEVDVRIAPKSKSSPNNEGKTIPTDKITSPEGVISDHRKFLPSSSQKFIPLGAIYRSAVESRESSNDIKSSKGGSTNYQSSDSELSPLSDGLRKHLPFRRPLTLKLKRLQGKLEDKDGRAGYEADEEDQTNDLSTLEKITLNKTPGVAIEYPPVFYSKNEKEKMVRRKRPYRRRPSKRRRKNRRKPIAAEITQIPKYDESPKIQEKTKLKGGVSSESLAAAKPLQEIPVKEYVPPKVDEPSKNYDLGTKTQYEVTTPSSIYITKNVEYLSPKPEISSSSDVIPSRNYETNEIPATSKYADNGSQGGNKGQVPGWLMLMQKNKKHPTPPPGYVPDTTTHQGVWKHKSPYNNDPSLNTNKNSYEVHTKKFTPSCNQCRGASNQYTPAKGVGGEYNSPNQNYELPQNENLPPNSFISNALFISQINETHIPEYLPPTNKPLSKVRHFMPSRKYEQPKLEYLARSKIETPNPNYEVPSQSYEVPQTEYLPPSTALQITQSYNIPSQSYQVPQNEYLPPAKSLTNSQNYNIPIQTYTVPHNEYLPPAKYDTTKNYNIPEQIYETPKNEYLPPARSAITQTYQVPVQSYETPKNEYLPPAKSSAIAQTYQVPVQSYETPKNEYLPPAKSAISQTYQVPVQSNETPKNEYLPPAKLSAIPHDYQVPVQSYETPKNEYLPPAKSSAIPQTYEVPVQSYETPKNEYLPPAKSVIPQTYQVPVQSYETPINEYLPPAKLPAITQTYQVPLQSYETPINEYLPPAKLPAITQTYQVPLQSYETPNNEYLPPAKLSAITQTYQVPLQSYETPKNDYLPPVKSLIPSEAFSEPKQSYESLFNEENRERANVARKVPVKNEYFTQPEQDEDVSYIPPSESYELPILEYLPPDNKTPVKVVSVEEVKFPPPKAYNPPSIEYISSKAADSYEEQKLTTRRPNLRVISQSKPDSKAIIQSKKAPRQRGRRPSKNYDNYYDVLDYYVDGYEEPHTNIHFDSNYEYYDYDSNSLPGSKLNFRHNDLIDYNFDIKENDILEYGYIIGIPGIAGIDYPILKYIPLTTFRCHLVADYPGYYADMEAGCQVFHVCHRNGRQDSFLCPNGTIFNQKYFVCDWWYNFSCEDAAFFYPVNAAIGQPDDSHSIKELELDQYGGSKRSSKTPSKSSSVSKYRRRTSIGNKRRSRPYRLRRRYSIMGAMTTPIYI